MTARSISLGGEGNVLYPVISTSLMSWIDKINKRRTDW